MIFTGSKPLYLLNSSFSSHELPMIPFSQCHGNLSSSAMASGSSASSGGSSSLKTGELFILMLMLKNSAQSSSMTCSMSMDSVWVGPMPLEIALTMRF